MTDMRDRYAKQRIFLGAETDAALRGKRVAIVGLGATGSVIATWLARSGVGHIKLIDRDMVELTNLQRQPLYLESDLGRPKAIAASEHLRAANGGIEIIPVVADLVSGNARELLGGHDLVMDGTDNFEARFLINDFAILNETPWIYAGVIGAEGIVWPIRPPETACLRCLMEEPPLNADVDTCDSAGVLGPAVGIIGGWAAMEGLKILSGRPPQADLARFDFWRDERQFLTPPSTRCRWCRDKVTEFLGSRWSVKASALCGLDGVQIRVNPPGSLDFNLLKPVLENRTGSTWKATELAMVGQERDWRITLFRDGRALIHGAVTPEQARSWYTEVIGC
jgi:molybdopterin/thiamine biosynthesis adenylyltransferase